MIHSVCYNFEETILGDESGSCQRPVADRLDARMVDYVRKNEAGFVDGRYYHFYKDGYSSFTHKIQDIWKRLIEET